MVCAAMMLLLLMTAPIAAAAVTPVREDIPALYADANGRLLSVARKGDWRNYPANSLAGIDACIRMGVDIVGVDVRKAADQTLVLMSGDDLVDNCVDAVGESVRGLVSEKTLAQLKEMRLRQGLGGEKAPPTTYPIATLREAIGICRGSAMLMVTADRAIHDDIYALLKETEALNFVILRGFKQTKELVDWVNAKDPAPLVTGYYKGNVVFTATSTAETCLKNNVLTVEFATGNTYGVLFDSFALKRFDGRGRVFMSCTDPKLSGRREDNTMGWDDLVSRGYSVIETDYPRDLVRYIRRTEEARQDLEETVQRNAAVNPAGFSPKSAGNFNNAMTQANALLTKGAVSEKQLEAARYALQQAADLLDGKSSGKAQGEFRMTPGGVIAVVLCSAGVILAQVYVRKKTKKSGEIL